MCDGCGGRLEAEIFYEVEKIYEAVIDALNPERYGDMPHEFARGIARARDKISDVLRKSASDYVAKHRQNFMCGACGSLRPEAVAAFTGAMDAVGRRKNSGEGRGCPL